MALVSTPTTTGTPSDCAWRSDAIDWTPTPWGGDDADA